MKLAIPLILILLSSFRVSAQTQAGAEEAKAAKPFTNESEVSIITITGNSESESHNFKQKNSYTWDSNVAKFQGQYLRTTSAGIESAYNWSTGLRYERILHDRFNLFLAQNVENDRYAGVYRRYNTDIGGKYYMIKTDPNFWFVEFGYRYITFIPQEGKTEIFHSGRLYTEYVRQFNPTVDGKIWVEYLPNFSVPESYQANSEASLTASLNSIFSVRAAYLIKYDNAQRPNVRVRADSTTTVTLVAKF